MNRPFNNPFKIIHKYKNVSKYSQYNIYIYLGCIKKDLMNILEKIQDLSLIDSLKTLTKDEIRYLEEYYKYDWYTHFFNTEHIKYSIKQIKKDKESFIKKHGKDYYDKHIEQKRNIKTYNYEQVFKRDFEKISKKFEILKKKDSIDVNIDYTTKKGGAVAPINMGIPRVHDASDDVDDDNTEQELEKIEQIEHLEELGSLEEIENLYENMEDVKEDTKTTEVINDILYNNNKKLKDKKEKLIEFDDSKDNLNYEVLLFNVYKKNYITNQYIYVDDTILTIKKKICYCILNNKSYIGEQKHKPYIIPSRQYLWGEYEYEKEGNKLRDKIMIGQKWIVKNMLVNIDIEPNNNISVYENASGNLRYLKDNLRKYGSKIKYESNENYILEDYVEFITNNEIYMLDIYNELGLNYKINSDNFSNLYNVYSKIYFFGLTQENLKNIVDYLNLESSSRNIEISQIKNIHENIKNELLLETEIMNTVELTKSENKHYKNFFLSNNITQCVVYTYLDFKTTFNLSILDLFKIFDKFIVSENYPFIQLKKNTGNVIFKSFFKSDSGDEDKNLLLSKWFESSPYGLSIKVKIDKQIKDIKYLSLNLFENGRLEYKSQWKEEDKIVMDDIYASFNYINKLIDKFHNENNSIKFRIPTLENYKFAFINCNQKFQITDKKLSINHNDLSDFARYFYPFIALVIEPRKRKSKKIKEEYSKFGTYLRFKRVSKYENNERIENIILYFMRNFEYTEKNLIVELSKQFNITEEIALQKYKEVQQKYPNIKKVRKVLKKLENIPKYKIAGIDITIQGKSPDQYKLKVSGAKNQFILEKILEFMNILLYLYSETYIKKNRSELKEKLKLLTNVAKRKNKVQEFIIHETADDVGIKNLIKLDKDRLGFKPDKGQNQWSRTCQNSSGMNRQPSLYTTEEELIRHGYIYNESSGFYEKKIKVKNKEETLIAVNLKSSNGENIYYTCNPEINKKYTYVGFFTKSNNPFGLCMPCCFKKNQRYSNNEQKKTYYENCIHSNEQKKFAHISKNEQLYVLQYHNKILDDRYTFLPNYLDILFNKLNNLTLKIDNYYLESTEQYYLLYGSSQTENAFLNAVSICYDIDTKVLRTNIIELLYGKMKESLFVALQNGDIKTQFGSIENYISYINENNHMDETLLLDLLTLPFNRNIYIFEKIKIIEIKENDEEEIKENYILLCTNNENVKNLYDKSRENIIILKDDKNYYPIFNIQKNKKVKHLQVIKHHHFDDTIIQNILSYYKAKCGNILEVKTITAKYLFDLLIDTDIKIKYQFIDFRNKCKYLITSDHLIIPVTISGALYNIKIISDLDHYLQDFETTMNLLIDLKKYIKYKIEGIYYEHKDGENYKISSIILDKDLNLIIPIKHNFISIKMIQKIFDKHKITNYIIEYRSLYEYIDKILQKKENINVHDTRYLKIKDYNYEKESYELLRLELSNYFVKNKNLKQEIMDIINKNNIEKDKKRNLLYKKLNSIIKDNFNIVRKINTINYEIQNHRSLCGKNDNIHCSNGKFIILNSHLDIFIHKLVEELITFEIKAYELLNIENYYVSDIIDYDRYIERDNQKLISSNNLKKDQILGDIFGKDIPIIGKQLKKSSDVIVDQKNEEIVLQYYGDIYIQKIISNNNTIYRAISNNYYWLKNKLYNINLRNLGHFSIIQTNLSNYFKSIVIDWLSNDKNFDYLMQTNLNKYIPNFGHKYLTKYKIDMLISSDIQSEYLIELVVLNKLLNFPIAIYNNYNIVKYVIKNKHIYEKLEEDFTEFINIKYNYFYGNKYPSIIEVIYYK